MNYFTTAVFSLSLLMISNLHAQIQTNSEPISYRTGLYIFDEALETYRTPALDMEQVVLEDIERAEQNLPPFDGRRIPVGWDMANTGEWFSLDNGDRLWKLKIHSPGALSIELYYDDFYLPQGAQLHLYSLERNKYLGAFTANNNKESGYFSTGMIEGETTIIEYYEPAEVEGEGRIRIQDVGHRYRDLESISRADDCQVDVNCPEGDEWQDEKHGVVRLRISVSGGGIFYCSGSLVNNTAMDCTPYVLSAFHCIDDIADSPAYQDQLRFYYNYERAQCGVNPAPVGQVMLGCSIVARSHNQSNGSDFVLLLLDDDIPETFEPYWNGWNLQSTTISGGGVGIHHPNGDEKKISTSTQNFISTSYFGTGPQAYWRVKWAETETGHGVTEGGSSGSPLFDSNSLIVGTLTGGTSYCNSVEPGGKDDPDWYGKMSYHWDQNTGVQTIDLKEFLDPLNTGQSVMTGSYAPCDGSTMSVDESDTEILDQLSIFPNPATDRITIDMAGYQDEIEQVTLYNVLGKAVSSSPVNTQSLVLDISDHPAGIYLVTFVFRDRAAMSQKVVIR